MPTSAKSNRIDNIDNHKGNVFYYTLCKQQQIENVRENLIFFNKLRQEILLTILN